jgi:hypothetical protein
MAIDRREEEMKEKVLRVDMTEKEITTEEWDSRKMPLLGCRALTSKILAENKPDWPSCPPEFPDPCPPSGLAVKSNCPSLHPCYLVS